MGESVPKSITSTTEVSDSLAEPVAAPGADQAAPETQAIAPVVERALQAIVAGGEAVVSAAVPMAADAAGAIAPAVAPPAVPGAPAAEAIANTALPVLEQPAAHLGEEGPLLAEPVVELAAPPAVSGAGAAAAVVQPGIALGLEQAAVAGSVTEHFAPVVVRVADAVAVGIVAPAPEPAATVPVGEGQAPESLAIAPLIVSVVELDAPLAEAIMPAAEQAEGVVENGFTNVVAVNNLAGQQDGIVGVSRLDGSEGDSDTDSDAPPVAGPALTVGDAETLDDGFQGLSPFASGLLARVAPFDPAVFELAMQKVVGRVGEMADDLVGSLEGPGLFSPEQPKLLPWLAAAAVAACAFEMSRRRQSEKSQAELVLAGPGPSTMWFPTPRGQ
jgi:hypothetical protein